MIDRSDKSKQVFTANDWANASECNETVVARLQAELTAWRYVQNLPERSFALIILNSGILVGPRLNEGKFFSSDFLKVVLSGKLPGLPNITIPFVDVRDAAKAFVMALEKEEANDSRFVISAIDLKMEKLAEMIKHTFPDYPVSTGKMNKVLLYAAAKLNNDAAWLYEMDGQEIKMDNEPSRTILNIEYMISTTRASSPQQAIA